MSFLKSCVKALLKPAADPRQGAVYTDERQREMLVKVRSLLAEIERAQHLLTEKLTQLNSQCAALVTQARTDVTHGREDVARRRLKRRQLLTVQQQLIQRRLLELAGQEQRLQQAEHRMVTHIAAYIARREALEARYNSAESQLRLNRGLQKLFRDLADLELVIERAETQTDRLEARASVLNEDVENDMWLNSVEAFNSESDNGALADLQQIVEAELSQLKKEVDGIV